MSLLHSRPSVPLDYYASKAWELAKARKTNVSRSLIGQLNGGKRCRVHMPMPPVLGVFSYWAITAGLSWRGVAFSAVLILASGLFGREVQGHHLTYRRIGLEKPSDIMWLCDSHHRRCERHIRRSFFNRRAATWVFVIRTWILRYLIALLFAYALAWTLWIYVG